MRGPPDGVAPDARRDLVGRDGAGVPVGFEPLVVEVHAEQAELPELVGDVLGRVGHRSVRAHEDLVRLLHSGELFGLREAQDPAAGVLALRLEDHRARSLEELERARPETPAQDVALAREQVVRDPEPSHRRQVRRGDRLRDGRRDAGGLVVARLDRVEHLGAPGLRLGPARVGPADLGVEVPAEVGEALRVRGAVRERGLADRATAAASVVTPARWTRPATTSATCTPVSSR